MRTRSLQPVLLGLVVVLVVGFAVWLLSSLAGTSAAPGSDEANPVPFVDRIAPRPSPELPPDPPEPAPASVAVCSDLEPEIREDPGNEAEPWIYMVTVTNSTGQSCALGGIPQVSVEAEGGDVLQVTVSGVPVPPVPEEVQPARFLVPPGGSASVGIQWGSFCPGAGEPSAVRFVIETEGAEVVTPSVRRPGCVSGGDELNLRPLYWMAPRGVVRIVSDDPLFSARISVGIVELSYPSPTSIRAVVEWRNRGDAVALDPCPYYEVTVGEGGRGRTDYFYLNCDEAPATLAAGASLFVEVLVADIPTHDGRFSCTLGDGYVDGEREDSKSARVDYRLP